MINGQDTEQEATRNLSAAQETEAEVAAGEESQPDESLRVALTGVALGALVFGVKAALRHRRRAQSLSTYIPPSPAVTVARGPSIGSTAAAPDPEAYAKLVRGAFDTLRSGHELRMGALGGRPGPRF